MTAPAATSRVPFTDEDLWRFLDQLRGQGYAIGPEQFAAVQLLLVRLASAGQLPENPRELARYMGPILCGTPRQQAEFRREFDVWIGPLLTRPVAAPSPEPEPASPQRDSTWEEELRRVRNRSRRFWLAAFAALLLGLGFVVFRWEALFRGSTRGAVVPPAGPEVQAPPPSLALPFNLEGAAAPVGALLGVAALVMLLRRRFLVRKYASSPPDLERFSVSEPGAGEWIPPLPRNVAVSLRQREVFEGDELDVERTVEACAAAGGWFSPVYETRSRIPEYLVLIDRASVEDLRAVRAQALVEQLAREGVYTEVYYFEGDPRLVYAAKQGSAARQLFLAELRTRYADHRLLVFSESENFVSSLTGLPHPWVSQLQGWKDRTLLTLVPVVDWGARERALSSAGFKLLPASPDGLGAVADVRRAQQVLGDARAVHPPRYPDVLAGDEATWVASNQPAPDELLRGLEAVRRYLGRTGTTWLAACAVYPEVKAALTLHLGEQLARPYQASILERLARLPWMRHGFIPDWLRRALLGELRGEREREVRNVLSTLLLAPRSASGDASVFEVARQNRPALARLWRWRSLAWRKLAPEGAPLRDHVFLSWMDNPLALRIPRALSRWLRERAWRPRPVTSDTLLPDTAHHFTVQYAFPLRGLGFLLAALPLCGVLGAGYGALSWAVSYYLHDEIGILISIVGVMIANPFLGAMLGRLINSSRIRGGWFGGGFTLLSMVAFTHAIVWGWLLAMPGDKSVPYSPFEALAWVLRMGGRPPSVTDVGDYLLWMLSAILLPLPFLFGWEQATRPVCPVCRSGTERQARLFGPLGDTVLATREILQGKYARLFALSRTPPDEADATILILERCTPACGATTLLSLKRRYTKRNAEGVLLEEVIEPLMTRLHVPEHLARAVAEWMQATPSICPNLVPADRPGLRLLVDVLLRMRSELGTEIAPLHVYGDILGVQSLQARQMLGIPADESIAALAVQDLWFVFPSYSSYAFTEAGIYAYHTKKAFTPYRDFSHLDFNNQAAVRTFLQSRQIKIEAELAAEALRRIIGVPGESEKAA